jgi:hypothetical protein
LDGALETELPFEYREYLENIPVYKPLSSRLGKLGGAVFLALWGPVMGLMEKITNETIRDDGYAPPFVIWMVRTTMFLIWFTHDWVFAPLIGRGDGRNFGDIVCVDEEAGCEEERMVEVEKEHPKYVL